MQLQLGPAHRGTPARALHVHAGMAQGPVAVGWPARAGTRGMRPDSGGQRTPVPGRNCRVLVGVAAARLVPTWDDRGLYAWNLTTVSYADQ